MRQGDGFGSSDKYWATEEDASQLIGTLRGRIKSFREVLRQTRIWRQIIRNWRYYYGQFWGHTPDDWASAIKLGGEQGELKKLGINHIRNLLQHILALTTSTRPAFDAKATNSDQKSLQQTRLGNNILEYYIRDKRLEVYLKRAAEEALVLSAGFVRQVWDPQKGREIAVNPQYDNPLEAKFIHEGDVLYSNPTVDDVVYDTGVEAWRELKWVLVRTRENRWDLASRFPTVRDEILSVEKEEDVHLFSFFARERARAQTDIISTWEFYHLPTEALPEGRFLSFAGEAKLIDTMELGGGMPYKDLPVHRIVPSDLIMTPFGYSPGFDLQGLQEAINSEASAITTNHDQFGVQNIWTRTGEPVTSHELVGGLNLVESDNPPQALNLTQTPPEIFKWLELLVGQGQLIIGVPAVTRGAPDRDMSGTSMALLDSKAVQYNSPFQLSYYQLLEDVGTALIRILQRYAKTSRVMAIAGKMNSYYMREWSGDDLSDIDRVVVQSSNPLSKTLSGRVEMAKDLLSIHAIHTPEEYLTVLETGQIQPLLQADQSQLSLIHDENERMIALDAQIKASWIDNQVLHIREHAALLATTEARNNPQFSLLVSSHLKEHFDLLQDPEVQAQQITLGYNTPIPPLPIAGPEMPMGGDMNQPEMSQSKIQAMGPMLPPSPELPQSPKVRKAVLPKPAQPPPTGAPTPIMTQTLGRTA